MYTKWEIFLAKQEAFPIEEIYRLPYAVEVADCDDAGRMRPSALCALLIEAATQDYDRRGLGRFVLMEQGMVFLLSQFSVQVARPIQYDEPLRVSTWEAGTKGVGYIRRYAVETDGLAVASANSTWILASPESHQLLRPTALKTPIHPVDRSVEAPECRRLRLSGGTQVGERVVRYSDLDMNGHLYSAVYADIMMDYLPKALLDRDLLAFQLAYQHEAKYGERMRLYAGEQEGAVTVRGAVGERDCFAAVLTFAPEK